MAAGEGDDGNFELCTTEPEDDTASTSAGFAPELLCDVGKQWQNEGHGNIILRVFFMEKPPPDITTDRILDVMREWSKYCGIRFVKADFLDQSEIRIGFEKGFACSAVGTDAKLPKYKGKRTMNLGWLNESTILHETGHALGLVHEHQHPEGKIKWDENKLIEDLADNGPKWSTEKIKKNIITPHKKSKVKGSKKMDPDSIMAYHIKKQWVKNASDPTIRQMFKRNTKLSTVDKKIIGEMYPKPTLDIDSDSSSDDENTGNISAKRTETTDKERVETDAGSELKQHVNVKSNGQSTSESAACPRTSPSVPKPAGANLANEDFVFVPEHLADLFRILLPRAELWETIGQLLKVPGLDIIKTDNAKADGCLRVMLSTWLNQINPIPTKQRLVEAVAAKDPKLAEKIKGAQFR